MFNFYNDLDVITMIDEVPVIFCDYLDCESRVIVNSWIDYYDGKLPDNWRKLNDKDMCPTHNNIIF